MTGTRTEPVAAGRLADQAEHAIRRLTHLTRPATGEPADPSDAADTVAALAAMTWMMPQLLGQLAHRLQHEHNAGRLRNDHPAPQPDPGQTVQTLAGNLQHASQALRAAAEALDTAHQHAAHLATAHPRKDPAPRGQDSCRSVGPNHLTRPTCLLPNRGVATLPQPPRSNTSARSAADIEGGPCRG